VLKFCDLLKKEFVTLSVSQSVNNKYVILNLMLDKLVQCVFMIKLMDRVVDIKTSLEI